MKDLKIKVNSEVESKEVQELLFKLGYKWHGKGKTVSYLNDVTNGEFGYLVAWSTGCFTNVIQMGCGSEDAKEITLAELRDMVKPMKEYLMPNRDYEYILTDAREGLEPHAKDWISIPDGAEIAIKFNVDADEHGVIFYKNDGKASASEKNNFNWDYGSHWSNAELLDENFADCGIDLSHKVLWQRLTQPEALPFIDDNPQSLNDQYAEIEEVRQALKDSVNHPSHYTQGKVECLDALESATIGKSGIEAVCVANIIKYLWRYEEKNGLEDIKKANFYLNRLIATLENNNG